MNEVGLFGDGMSQVEIQAGKLGTGGAVLIWPWHVWGRSSDDRHRDAFQIRSL